MKTIGLFVLCALSCQMNRSFNLREEAIEQIIKTEKEFAEMTAEHGIAEAFLHFADEDAVLFRAGNVYKGKESIKMWFDSNDYSGITLLWVPDFVDAAVSGDLGYSYGKYQISSIDSSGSEIHAEGIFHTVWKKQADGEWRFVWD
jgi:ketosteroid isomerase-like protein